MQYHNTKILPPYQLSRNPHADLPEPYLHFQDRIDRGVRNTNLMTLVASAHRNDLDVTKCLDSVITHMLRGTARVEEWLPNVWKTHHPEALRTYREEERSEKVSTAFAHAAKSRIRSELRKSLKVFAMGVGASIQIKGLLFIRINQSDSAKRI